MSELPHQARFVIDSPPATPDMSDGIHFYRPRRGNAPTPAIVFVHGMPFPPERVGQPSSWPVYRGYGAESVCRNVTGVMFDHCPDGKPDYPRSAATLAATIERIRADPGVDADRIALWHFSGGGPLSADYLRQPPPWLRCLALTYPAFGFDHFELPERFQASAALDSVGALPVVLTTVERERAEIAQTVSDFISPTRQRGVRLEMIEVRNARHGFDFLDHTEESRQAVRWALDTVVDHLAA